MVKTNPLTTTMCLLVILAFGQPVHSQDPPEVQSFPIAACRDQPQWRTGARLLKLGEAIDFEFFVPPGIQPGNLSIYSRYLEQAQPAEFSPTTADLGWLDDLVPEPITLAFKSGRATVNYTPARPGSYLASWHVGAETMYRYFAAIEDDWIVLRMSTFEDLEAEPTLHATGIPLDYRLPAERFDPSDQLF